MKTSLKTITALSALALSSAAGASASLSVSINAPSIVGQIIGDALFGRSAPACHRVLRMYPDGERYWGNTCDNVVYNQPVAPVYYTQPAYVQPVYAQPVYSAPVYGDDYDYNTGTYYNTGTTYSYPVRTAAPVIYQHPSHTTIINTNPRW